ncbi:MAG: VCBS repeat-containing protein, partial [Verrucomicrobia bacterium]|nr:VCBS repeat-containing protein [Verrucomicrobiota bacterium]
IACEWGPLRILYNNNGQLKEEDRGLGAFPGWWTSVATGDFDEDGRPDIVAGNLGDNTEYRATSGRPWKIRFGDLRGAGSCDIVESYFDEATGEEVPHRTLRHIGMAFPFVRDVAETFEAYGKSNLKTLYGERLAGLATWEIRHVLSTVFLNRGDRFEARTLPGEIQWSPVMGLVVADLDGDGHEDIAVSQNFFGMAPDSWRRDAGRGAVLRGDGKGGFTPVANSGLRVYGEGRGLAVGDFDRDGRADLLAAQNGAETQLYRNALARPGLRIQVSRDDGGVGTSLRARAGGTWGPLREIKAGSGYGSQDSLTTLMSAPGKGNIDALAVRFPRGAWRTNQISAELREIQIRPDGSISGTVGKN